TSAVPHLLPNELYALSPGEPLAGGAIAVVAPGTGLGEAFLTWDGTDYCVPRRKAAMPTLPRPVQR
ncbi:MAG TPA: glucokinase, partial [Verrucomicrobiae bacterium]|nr:glucokinase [Verrucomicrobiae bacterium]